MIFSAFTISRVVSGHLFFVDNWLRSATLFVGFALSDVDGGDE